MLDPELYTNDPLFSTLKDYTTLSWQMLYPLFKIIGIELTLFFAHLVSFILLTSGTFSITKELTKNWKMSLFSAVCVVFPQITFGTVTITGNYFAPRFLAISICVWSIYFFIRKRYLWTFVLLGIASLINLTFAAPIIAAASLFILFTKNIKAKSKLSYFAILFLIISPLLYLKFFQSQGSSGLIFNYDWVNNVRTYLQVYLKLPDGQSGNMDWIGFLFGIFHVAVIFYLLKVLKISKEIKKFILILCLVCLVLIITTYFLWQLFPLVLLFQMQLTRAGYIFPVISIVLLLTYIFNNYRENKKLTFSDLLLIITTLTGLIPLSFILVINKFKIINILVLIVLAALLINFPIHAFINWPPIDKIKFQIYPENNQDLDLQNWMKANSDINDLFIVPTYLNEVFLYNYRVFSERAILFSNIELGQVSLSYGFEKSLTERADDLTKGRFSEALKTNRYGEIFKALFEGFDSLNEEDIIQIANKYKANYLVVEKYKSYNLNLVFENEKYKVYEIPEVYMVPLFQEELVEF